MTECGLLFLHFIPFVRPEGCSYCWRIEDVGGRSDRVYRSGEYWAQESKEDIAMRIRLIARGLSDYPADIFLYAVKSVSHTKTFFPSLSEFRDAGEWRYQKRVKLLDMIQNATKR